MKKIVSIILITVPAVLLILIFASRLQGGVPSLFGFSLFDIVSGSMEPELHVGDIIVSRKNTEKRKIKVGDVVTYYGTTGEMEGQLITHKVVEIYEESGKTMVITQGVANSLADPAIEKSDIVCIMVCKTRVLTFLFGLYKHTAFFIFLYIIPMIFVIGSKLTDIIRLCKGKEKDDEKSLSENSK